MTPERKTFQPVTSKDICQIYGLLQENNLVSFALTAEAIRKTDTLVANINATYFGNNMYKTAEEKAVAYLYFLIKDHPFTDGNKRTATLTFKVVCDINDLNHKSTDIQLDELAVFIEKTQEQDHHKVIREITELIFN